MGLCIAAKGLSEYEAINNKDNTDLYITLLRSVGWLSKGTMPMRRFTAGPHIKTPDAQCIGNYLFEYAIIPFGKNKKIQDLFEIAQNFRYPCIGIQPQSINRSGSDETLRKSLEPEKTKSAEELERALAAKGLSTSGGVYAGTQDINEKYADLLSSALQKFITQGQKDVYSRATTGKTSSPDYSAIGEELKSEESARQAAAYESQKKAASGWSWLLPAVSAIASIAGGPIGQWIGSALGLGTAIAGTGKKTETAKSLDFDEYGNYYGDYGETYSLPDVSESTGAARNYGRY
jgi:hypothetical protein